MCVYLIGKEEVASGPLTLSLLEMGKASSRLSQSPGSTTPACESPRSTTTMSLSRVSYGLRSQFYHLLAGPLWDQGMYQVDHSGTNRKFWYVPGGLPRDRGKILLYTR